MDHTGRLLPPKSRRQQEEEEEEEEEDDDDDESEPEAPKSRHRIVYTVLDSDEDEHDSTPPPKPVKHRHPLLNYAENGDDSATPKLPPAAALDGERHGVASHLNSMSIRTGLRQPTEQEQHRDDDDDPAPHQKPKPIPRRPAVHSDHKDSAASKISDCRDAPQAVPPSRHRTSPLPDLTDEDIPMPVRPLPTTVETTPAPRKAKKGSKKTARTTVDSPRRTSGRNRRPMATRCAN
ncbi:hypothetical protein K503DRAFT_798587 [Rhizopogon vinicolor AM-OR11-026]|uniref:Uncharacterized protein n=1 Tax=Rhizopogon vinicolor AM-OR11-026 TaxID=1314800 RepID=A0A1B7N769_9AGAM|nr:hypothetical protein K503DRAFT_798587 [Rhizopogon vinicolor AM-OR11-026]